MSESSSATSSLRGLQKYNPHRPAKKSNSGANLASNQIVEELFTQHSGGLSCPCIILSEPEAVKPVRRFGLHPALKATCSEPGSSTRVLGCKRQREEEDQRTLELTPKRLAVALKEEEEETYDGDDEPKFTQYQAPFYSGFIGKRRRDEDGSPQPLPPKRRQIRTLAPLPHSMRASGNTARTGLITCSSTLAEEGDDCVDSVEKSDSVTTRLSPSQKTVLLSADPQSSKPTSNNETNADLFQGRPRVFFPPSPNDSANKKSNAAETSHRMSKTEGLVASRPPVFTPATGKIVQRAIQSILPLLRDAACMKRHLEEVQSATERCQKITDSMERDRKEPVWIQSC